MEQQMNAPPIPSTSAGPSAPQDEPTVNSAFPRPPLELIQWYSDAHVADGNALPPPLPPHGAYVVFGEVHYVDEPVLRPLEEQGVKRLYPPLGQCDRKIELKKLNHSILANFLDLLEILIRCPASSERQQKVQDIELIFINMHHLLNEYRPHQARETLRLMLEFQNEERVRTVERFQKFFEVVANKLRACLADIPLPAELPPDIANRLSTILAELPVKKKLDDLAVHQPAPEIEQSQDEGSAVKEETEMDTN